jgi:hypothetical protein
MYSNIYTLLFIRVPIMHVYGTYVQYAKGGSGTDSLPSVVIKKFRDTLPGTGRVPYTVHDMNQSPNPKSLKN